MTDLRITGSGMTDLRITDGGTAGGGMTGGGMTDVRMTDVRMTGEGTTGGGMTRGGTTGGGTARGYMADGGMTGGGIRASRPPSRGALGADRRVPRRGPGRIGSAWAPRRRSRPVPPRRLRLRGRAPWLLSACVVLALWAGAKPALAFGPVDRDAASDLAARCLPAVMDNRAADVTGLRRVETPLADRLRDAGGGEVWRPTFGDVWLHQAGPRSCTLFAPGADARGFAYWVERWSNGDGRHWQGRWFGRLDATAWRAFRRRGGHSVTVVAVTGAERETAIFDIRRRAAGR
jgi:hypothetical protein